MIYEPHSEVVHSSKSDEDVNGVEVKYVTNPRTNSKKHSKNFANVNFRVIDEAKVPLQMSEMEGDMMIDESSSDNSSGDIDFDDTKPIIQHIV